MDIKLIEFCKVLLLTVCLIVSNNGCGKQK